MRTDPLLFVIGTMLMNSRIGALTIADMDNTSSSAIPAHPDPDAPASPGSPQYLTDFTLINAEGFQPFVLHKPHEPVPIALVNRAPHGSEYLIT